MRRRSALANRSARTTSQSSSTHDTSRRTERVPINPSIIDADESTGTRVIANKRRTPRRGEGEAGGDGGESGTSTGRVLRQPPLSAAASAARETAMQPSEAPREAEHAAPPPAHVPPPEIVSIEVTHIVHPAPLAPVESPVEPLQIPPTALPLPPLPSAPPPPVPAPSSASTGGQGPAAQVTAGPQPSNAALFAQLRGMDFAELHEHFRQDIATKLNDPLWGIPKDRVRDALKMNTGACCALLSRYHLCRARASHL